MMALNPSRSELAPRRVRAPGLTLMKSRGERIVMLTAYDATMARLLDRAGTDVLLVGDSLGQVILGLGITIVDDHASSIDPAMVSQAVKQRLLQGRHQTKAENAKPTTCLLRP